MEEVTMMAVKEFFGMGTEEFSESWKALTSDEKAWFKAEVAKATGQE